MHGLGRTPTHCTALLGPHSTALVGETPTAHFTGDESLKQLAKYLNTLPLTLGDPEPLALFYISRISGGEHPPNFTVLGKALCGACPRRHGRDAQGQKQQLGERDNCLTGTTSPSFLNLPSSTNLIHEWRISTSKAEHVHTPRSPNRHILSAVMPPPPPPPPSWRRPGPKLIWSGRLMYPSTMVSHACLRPPP